VSPACYILSESDAFLCPRFNLYLRQGCREKRDTLKCEHDLDIQVDGPLPPKSPTLIVLNATTEFRGDSRDSALFPHRVTRTEQPVSSMRLSSNFLT